MQDKPFSGEKWQVIDGFACKAEIAIYVNIGLSLISVPITVSAIEHGKATDPARMMQGLTAACFVAAELLCYIVAGVFFCIWMYRAYINALRLTSADDISEQKIKTAGVDVIGGWLIPIYNLFKPYQNMAMLWRSSDPKAGSETDWKNFGVPSSLKLWWGLWIAMQLIGRVSDASMISLLFAAGIKCGAGYLAIQLMKAITQRQTHLIHMRDAQR
jgi:hypothetical protein